MARIKLFGTEAELTNTVKYLKEKGIVFTAIEVYDNNLSNPNHPQLTCNLFDVRLEKSK